ncbi:MAG: hydroxymethylpyrimidine/phosphomethylpyrimidine kinase [Alphaproteobacteria bacterium]|nr:hydroxymethylpyrimidine/phosphomethylpyrimidine kinase [Alphaproteobacteria bacterium]
MNSIARILVIAGSDSGGGAGIQADIRTITTLGGYAMTAITAITAQNTLGVQGVHPVPVDMVLAQIDSVVTDIGVDAVKIGMIGSAGTAQAVADYLFALDRRSREGGDPSPMPVKQNLASGDGFPPSRERRNFVPIVFDPVMVATSGSVLADADTIAAFERLIRIATVVTPNIPELEALGGDGIASLLGCTVLAKGGHGAGGILVDRLFDAGGEIARWEDARIDTPHTHGTGCTLASAIAVGLGQGMTLTGAIARARHYVRAALLAAPGLGHGHGPMGVPRDA